MECSQYTEERKRMYETVAYQPTSDVTLQSLLNPTENQPRAVNLVLEFIAAMGLHLWKWNYGHSRFLLLFFIL